MPPLSRHRSLALLISSLAADICMADGAGPSDLQHKIRAFKTDIPIPLDGDLAKWRSADTVTFAGKLSLAILGMRLSTPCGTREIFTWHLMSIPRNQAKRP
jgi:hypothetical protein